ncbi:helix-turn-helix transcriptional regulator [Streptomyces sp. ODS28]|uniref:helix-turn-helix domain-containing protein n=1 Tax=Streptomyces sp. ODS28 TaxID=3136688 RepID=UPI0031F19FB8
MASLNVGNLGEFLREQRQNAKLSLRQLADAAGVSNPYLSQIERGLRKPSADILQQLAKALRISAETLYVQAGILDERDRADLLQVPAAILADSSINDQQKQALLQIYDSFRKENGASSAGPATDGTDGTDRAEDGISGDSVNGSPGNDVKGDVKDDEAKGDGGTGDAGTR